MLIPDLQTK